MRPVICKIIRYRISVLLRIILPALILMMNYMPAESEEVQWASEVKGFSSQFKKKRYSAAQVLGKPSVMPDFGHSYCAWAPGTENSKKPEWIVVGFNKPIHVQRIAVAENYNPGTIQKIYLYDSSGKEYAVYSNPVKEGISSTGKMNNIFIPRTKYKVHALKLALNTFPVKGFNQIDAIGIADTKVPIKHKINIAGEGKMKNKPENLGKNINTIFSEVAPVISQDGKTLYFTRGSNPEEIGQEYNQDVWVSKIDKKNNFTPAKNPGYPINNQSNNFAISLTPDGNALLLGNIYKKKQKGEKGISISYFQGDSWSFPEKVNIKNYYNKSRETGYCLGSDGKTLFLTIERDDSYGGMDVYISHLEKDGIWSEPENLGHLVNTAADEASPFLASDGKTLYYSTSGFCGYGNNDMFMTRRLDNSWKNWSEPENLGPGLNTHGWDAYYTIPASGDYAYIVSNRNSYGKLDIFRVPLPEELRPKPVALISGKVLNSKTKEPLAAKIIYETLPDGKEAGIARSNPKTGEYKIVLPGGEKYGFLAAADGFIAVNENLNLREIQKYSEITRDLYLVPIEVGQTVQLNNIFFEFAKYGLLEDSYSELNRVTLFLKENPGIKIEIRGHTDNIGARQTNLILSRKRARAVSNYLISNGIAKKRMITKGLGYSQPIAPNDSEVNRRKNRRVEFVILKKSSLD